MPCAGKRTYFVRRQKTAFLITNCFYLILLTDALRGQAHLFCSPKIGGKRAPLASDR
jgi:hypothetical protein